MASALLQKIRMQTPTDEDLRQLFLAFAHEEERGWRLSPGEFEKLMHSFEQGLPEGFVARLYEAWAPGLPHLTEGRFLPGFRVYLDQRQDWLQQWWLAKSGGTSQEPPSHHLMAEIRKDHDTVDFDHFQAFCISMAEQSGDLPPPGSFLRSVWKAAVDMQESCTGEISDAAYDALLKAYVAQWREWLEDWIMERRVLAVEEEEDAEVKAAVTVQRHYRAFRARREVKGKKLEKLLEDLPSTMADKARCARLFERFDSDQKDCWTAEDMSRFCTELWQQEGLRAPPETFGLDALKKVRTLAGARAKKTTAKAKEEAEVEPVLKRDEFRRGLLPWNEKRYKQLQKWERERYCETYACPCCRGRFRVTPGPAIAKGPSLEIAKVVEEAPISGVAALGVPSPPRFALPGRIFAAPGSAARKLPHPSDVARLHHDVARDVAQGAGLCVLPPGAARPALSGRLLLQAAVAGSSSGAPLLLLAQDPELQAVELWLSSASPGYPLVKFSPQEPWRWQESIGKVTGRELPRLLLASQDTFAGLLRDGKARGNEVDYVLMACGQDEVPMLQECGYQDSPFSITSKRPRVVCLLDSASQVHQALREHLQAVHAAKDHMSNALRHLEAAKSSAVGGFAHKHLEEFQKQMSRYPAAVHPVPESFEAMGEETSEVLLPLGFTGPLQPLKRHAVLRSFQDDSEASEEEAITFEPALSEPEPIPEKPPAQAAAPSFF